MEYYHNLVFDYQNRTFTVFNAQTKEEETALMNKISESKKNDPKRYQRCLAGSCDSPDEKVDPSNEIKEYFSPENTFKYINSEEMFVN